MTRLEDRVGEKEKRLWLFVVAQDCTQLDDHHDVLLTCTAHDSWVQTIHALKKMPRFFNFWLLF